MFNMLYLRCGDTMKKILKFIGAIILIIYAGIAMILTVFLLKYNDYNITEFNSGSIVLVKDNDLNPDFNKGDLVFVHKNINSEIEVGNKIFFYEFADEQVSINLGSVIEKEVVTDTESTFVMDGGHAISSEYVLGKAETSHSYAKLGSIVSILESRMGFLFIIIFPILIFFIYEIYAVIKEIKSPDEK